MSNVVDYLSQLIAHDTVSNRSNEAVSDLVAMWLHVLGFEIERTSYHDRAGVLKCNVVGKRGPLVADASAPGLAYFCHTDTVTADRWSGPGGDPFAAVQQGSRVYGRGACDMKGSLATMLAAAATVDANSQRGPLWIVCTADEERGFEGAQHLAKHSAAFAELAAVDPPSIIGEPTQLQVIHAHKGIVGFRVVSKGHAAHSSMSIGVNANIAMVPMLQTLLKLDERCRTDVTLRNEMFDPPTLTWNFGVSDGMTTVNIVPDHSTAWACFRTMPGVDGHELIDTVRARAEELGLSFELFSGGEPMQTAADSQCVIDLCKLATPIIGENQPQAVCYATDACALGALNQRMVCGPGSIEQAHTVDEFIELDQLENGIAIYAAAIRHWC